MRRVCLALILILSVSSWIACNKGGEGAGSGDSGSDQVDSPRIAQLMTEVKTLKEQFDTAEDQKTKDDAMTELSGKLELVLSENPNHPEANAMMDDVQMYYAMQWAKQGKYSKAMEIVDSLLQFSPDNQKAQEMKANFENWMYMDKEEFEQIKKGMYMDEVEQMVGYPLRKTEDKDKLGRKVYGWFYKEPKLQKAVSIWFNENGQVYSTRWPK